MARILRRLLLFVSIAAFACPAPPAEANPVGDFFKKVGRSISKLKKTSPPPKKTTKEPRSGQKDEPKPEASPPVPSVTPSPTATPIEIRPATSAPLSRERSRDVPYGVVVPEKPGLVTSPYAPNAGFVDVRAFPSSTEVMDPFTGKIFLTP